MSSGFASEEDAGSVTVTRRDIVVVMKVVVVVVVGRPLLVKYTELYVVDSGAIEEIRVGEVLMSEELVSFHPPLLMPGKAERVKLEFARCGQKSWLALLPEVGEVRSPHGTSATPAAERHLAPRG